MNTFFLRSLFLLFLCFCIQIKSHATHIIGGEILLQWSGNGNWYNIVLNKYSNINTTGYVINDFETVFIYEKGTDRYLGQLSLARVSNTVINSNANFCSNPTNLNTSLQIYKAPIDLSALNSFGSYYLSWTDCCRNQDIINLSNPLNEITSLYTEFMGWGQRNNSPQFVPLANEFFCRNNLNFFDLSAIDPDGDALVYSLVSPRSSISPSTDVLWTGGASGTNPIPGNVPFQINASTGMATFDPSTNGIYVFGIMVEEYRNGNKIGEVRKDFQLNVQDCPLNNKPVVAFEDRAIKENDTLTVQLRGETCFPIYVTDVDATQFFISETIFINASSTLPSNSANVSYPTSGYKMPTEVSLTGFRDTARFNACFDPCAGGLRLDQTTYYPFKIIINDNRCPSKYDTLIFTIKIIIDANTIPAVFIDPPTDPKIVKVNEVLNFKVYGSDVDAGDLLSLRIDNPQREMFFTNVKDSSSTISSNFSWTPNCNDLNPGIYDVYFIIADNSCLLHPSDTVRQTIIVEQDEVSFDGMQVTNLITPNGDGLNDYYHIPGIPIGNCDKYFKGIEIYNRWGSRVFYSEDRLFKWYPDVSDGMYYFSIDLNYEVRKGWLQITE